MPAKDFDLDFTPSSSWPSGAADDAASDDEVEIAHIVLGSTLGDVISLYARPDGGRIHYRIVEGWTLPPTISEGPLSFREMIRLIDDAGHEEMPESGSFPDSLRNFQVEMGSDPADIAEFVTVTSNFYPELEAYYAGEARRWFKRQGDDTAF